MSDLDELQRRAATGDANAQYELGAILLVGRDAAPFAPEAGSRLIELSAAQGHTGALQLYALVIAAGVNGEPSFLRALEMVSRAADMGDARAQGQLDILGGPTHFDLDGWLSAPRLEQHFDSPRVFTCEGLLSDRVCKWLIRTAEPRMARATIKDPIGGLIVDPRRSNSHAGFTFPESDLITLLARLRIASAIGVPVSHFEVTSILKYAIGEQYKPHFDFITPDQAAAYSGELKAVGQRQTTVLVYLNDTYEGGETFFERLDWRFKGRVGEALIFWNVAEGGGLERNSVHAGLSVTEGEKWLLSQWVRQGPLRLQ